MAQPLAHDPEALAADKAGIAPRDAVAAALDTTQAGLAQMRYRGTGPRYIKRGGRIIYRWADVNAYLDSCVRTSTSDTGAA